jgi:uncharacterized protein (DUF305 family)
LPFKCNLQRYSVEETRKLRAMVTHPQHAADIARLMILVKRHGEIKADESSFKQGCKKKLGEMTRWGCI